MELFIPQLMSSLTPQFTVTLLTTAFSPEFHPHYGLLLNVNSAAPDTCPSIHGRHRFLDSFAVLTLTEALVKLNAGERVA